MLGAQRDQGHRAPGTKKGGEASGLNIDAKLLFASRCKSGTVAQEHALPREVSYGLILTGMGTWAYKPAGEVAVDAVREVGVTRGTQEPGNNRNPGIASSEGRRADDPTGVGQGEGVTSGDGELSVRTGE